ncbi:GGDEF domain-containing protein [uncultured Paraglaciecola sp.]|uniref:GGDEF domain-containing protein n=1 Tax=uncultured Paraglaciecola sp. TaxID=1765024 RepID=UPI0030D891EA
MKVLLAVSVFVWLSTSYAYAEQSEDIEKFIIAAQAATYDCPKSDITLTLDNYLVSDDLDKDQHDRLNLIKSHSLICVGQYEHARDILNQLFNDDSIDKSSALYAGAVYQLGFIFDVQENPKRCDYYSQAESLARDRYSDIYLSAQLGLITVCNQNSTDISVKLGKLYSLLEKFVELGDVAAIAHIHNNIGLLYGGIGQNELAAEQYLKSYYMGLEVYATNNQLATLISAISANMASGDFVAAKQHIEIFRRANLTVNTPLTNAWLHYAESRYYFRLQEYKYLRNSLLKLNFYLPKVSSDIIHRNAKLYGIALCVYDNNKTCVETFIQEQEALSDSQHRKFLARRDYLWVMANAYFYTDNLVKAQDVFDLYVELTNKQILDQQRSGRVLGVANLHSQITSLENELEQQETQKYRSIVMLTLAFILLLAGVYFFIVKRYIKNVSSDTLTGLYNERAVVGMMRRLPHAQNGRTNALALIDISNVRTVQGKHGHTVGEKALQAVSHCLLKVTREEDVVGRVGNEQFVVCLRNIDETLAREFFERVQSALNDTQFLARVGEYVSIESQMSIYISVEGFSDIEEVLSDMRDSFTAKSH